MKPPSLSLRLPLRRVASLLLLAVWPALVPAAPDTATLPRECGTAVRTTRVCDVGGRCESGPVLTVDDAWHGLAQCMRGLRDIWSRRGADTVVSSGSRSLGPVDALVARQLRFEFTQERVRASSAPGEPVAVLSLLNDQGQPYNAMGQSGLAYFAYQFAALAAKTPATERAATAADGDQYRRWGRAMLRGIVTPVEQGGLASWRDCDAGSVRRCAWFHSVTRRDLPTRSGATLNQHLHAVRDMAMILAQSRRENWTEPLDLRGAYLAGLAQMVAPAGGSEAMPNLEDFLGPAEGSEGVRWAYYGYNPAKAGRERTYFLDTGGKDCNYHFHVVELLSQVAEQARGDEAGRGLVDRLLQCRSPMAELLRTEQVRRESAAEVRRYSRDGARSASGRPRDYSCPAAAMAADTPPVAALRQQLSTCPR